MFPLYTLLQANNPYLTSLGHFRVKPFFREMFCELLLIFSTIANCMQQVKSYECVCDFITIFLEYEGFLRKPISLHAKHQSTQIWDFHSIMLAYHKQ